MKINICDSCILVNKDWSDLEVYTVLTVDGDEIWIEEASHNSNPMGIHVKRDELFVSPFRLFAPRDTEEYINSQIVVDLARTFIRESTRIEVQILIDKIKSYPKLKRVPVETISSYLKCLVANKYLKIWSDKRQNEKTVFIELSERAIAAERNRKFTGTLGGELHELSERIRLLISHTGTVGTYRENLLRSLLKKHLPERYHVATGFVYGCSRQVDILIYDRIDYSPIFREDDLVVVSYASVRAVIEVKTRLTKAELQKGIFLIDELSQQDVEFPPIFKGIFAFESDKSFNVLKKTLAIYNYQSVSYDGCADQIVITQPHQHVTSVCVLNNVVGHVYYEMDFNSNHIVPVLYSISSVSKLKSQVAFFLDSLLSHIRVRTIKEDEPSRILVGLGADSVFTRIGSLTEVSWGPYFREEEGMTDDGTEVEAMELDIKKYNEWLNCHIRNLE